MARAPRSAEELKEASGHLAYEVMMFLRTGLQVISTSTSPDETAGDNLTEEQLSQVVIRNATLESFGVHFRALVAFAYITNSPIHSEDIRPTEFAPQWVSKKMPADVQKAYLRVHQEIAHISYGRLKNEVRTWRIRELIAPVKAEILRFLSIAHALDETSKASIKATMETYDERATLIMDLPGEGSTHTATNAVLVPKGGYWRSKSTKKKDDQGSQGHE